MDRARIHEGIRRMRFTDIAGRSERSELSQREAAELLGISERTFRRWRDRYREAGEPGLEDRRLAPSLRRAPVAEIERMLGLYKSIYEGFTVKHFHEQLTKRHNYTLGYAAPGCLDARLAERWPRQARSRCHNGRRNERDLLD